MIFVINIFLVCLNTAVSSLLICVLALIKAALPVPRLRKQITRACHQIMWAWSTLNHRLINATSRDLEWDVQGGEGLSKDGWYLLIANHLSWADIVVIYCTFRNRIPMAKFFMKQELIYIPFLGLACWAVDMPFMKRYSRSYLHKHPEKRGEDMSTTRRACAKFKDTPTTVVNFVEGTRFTTEKQQAAKSPYSHLLPAKTGGISYTLGAMGDQFSNIVNVTIAYPDNQAFPFRDLIAGRMKRIVVRIETLPVNEAMVGDHLNEKGAKREFRQWLDAIWLRKDQELDVVYGEAEKLPKGETVVQH
ncbi:acyltransferase [Veronia nyctiphanis]|uniref:Acyltransferase n=1 Tax=Veronia nyctiphanis TaxID=1278244 RepID=A0A4Q0YMQ8_9GAMM|nr:acyltransferase [Veronia nyctiphanis]RXJ72167.1 acyltransferase [Veronia nyctiphanis]